MRRSLLLLAILGCASERETVTPFPAPSRIELRQRPPAPPFDRKAWASQQPTPAECEASARQMKDESPDDAWHALLGCIERKRWVRGEFTQLDLLTSGFWDEEIQSRPEAANAVARVIAMRGGDVDGDLTAVQKRRMPLFALAAAMKQPAVYKGRYVLLRGQLDDLKTEGTVTTAMLQETSLRAVGREAEVGLHSHTSHTASWTHSVTSTTTTRDGSHTTVVSPGRASFSGERYDTRRIYENDKVATGRIALGRLPEADPFLEPQKDFVFLTRFDGLRASPSSSDKPVAVLMIINYYEPSPLVVE